MKRRGRALSLQQWLIAIVIAIVGICGAVEVAVSIAIFHVGGQAGWQSAGQVGDAQLASVRRIIGTDAAQWRQAGWQRRAGAALGAIGVEVALVSGKPGHLAFATPGARQFLDTGILAATARSAGSAAVPVGSQATVSSSTRLPLFGRMTIVDPAQPAGAHPPIGTAFLWFTRTSSVDGPWVVLWPLAGVLTFSLALAFVAWLMRRSVLRPLAAMSEAAESIAGGDLDLHFPPSAVREIAEVTAALEGMSGALKDSLVRQSALEEDRRLFIGAIAHDLRTPLFTLRAYLQGLQKGIAATPEKVREYVDECAAKADALERLISDLFAFTRLEYLEQEPERAPLELGALLRQTVEGARPLAAAKDITLALDGPSEPCPLLGDRHLLARVIENLLDNAVRHTPSWGEIRVLWGRTGDTLSFAVADSGPGIAMRDLPHLFTPLFRGEASRNRQTGGAGLGLAIAHRILGAHGGELSAANGPAGGAVFTGTLPAAAGAPSVGAATASHA
ncbi:MAG: histidine kinase [Chloroflexi bacterium]|nr:histidine kinase [Chloroflexota bacterium]